MPKKKDTNNQSTSVRAGNISNVSGELYLAGRDIIKSASSGLGLPEIRLLFLDIYRDIDARPSTSPTVREDLKEEVKEIETTVTEATQKNEKVDEGFIARRFRNLARMAPDMLDVIAAMLASPLAGLGVAAKKIAEKAKEEAK